MTITTTKQPKPNKDGWIRWRNLLNEFEVECCDCGLIHTLQFRVRKHIVQGRAKRGKREEEIKEEVKV